MSVVSVKARSFILALFIRDDGERFLLGDNGYDFKDSQLHFAGNTIENDEVVKQGADGVILAGQVRRSAVQSFDGYIGDGTTPKETIEQMRRDFIAFFAKSHHFRVIYVDCNRNAWQRKGGYLVDAPEVKELWQIHPEYHVGLNFEDVNYYSYDEDADGNEILANVIDVPVSTEVAGGLVWDEDGAVSEDAGNITYDTEEETATPAKNVYITDATEAPLASFRLDGETSQNGTPTPSAPVPVQTVTGENVVKISDGQNEQSYEINLGKNLFDKDANQYLYGYFDNSSLQIVSASSTGRNAVVYLPCEPSTTYTINAQSLATCNIRAISTTEVLPANGVAVPREIAAGFDAATFTTPSSAHYIVIRYRAISAEETIANNIQTIMASLQVEKGSQATSYAAYFEPIELCKIGDYQDYIYKSGGKWYVRKEIGEAIIDGSETWNLDSGNHPFFVANIASKVVAPASSNENSILCDQYAPAVIYAANTNIGFIILSNGTYLTNLRIREATMPTLADFKARLAQNNATIHTALATPTDTEITNEALVAQLETLLNTARTYAGVNNIFTVTPNEQGTLEISYYTKYQPIVTEGGYIWEAGGTGGTTTVVNDSIGSVNPIWKVYGPTTNPVLENITTGEQIEYIGTISNGQTLTIDMGEQTASLDGLNVISNVIGDYISLASGANTLVYSVTGEAGASELGWSEIVG